MDMAFRERVVAALDEEPHGMGLSVGRWQRPVPTATVALVVRRSY
jgi:hypothetical protein